MRHKIVIIRISHQSGEHPAPEALIAVGFQQVLSQEQFVESGGGLHQIKGALSVIKRLCRIAQAVMACMAEFVGYRENIRHAAVPCQQDKRVFAIKRFAVSPGIFAFVLCEIKPAPIKRFIDHPCIVFAEDGERAADKLPGFRYGDPGIIAAVQRQLQIGKGHSVQPVYSGDQAGVFSHGGGQQLGDKVDLPVIQILADVLAKKICFGYGTKSPLLCFYPATGQKSVVAGSRCVFVLPQLMGKCAESRAADRRISLELVVILKE